MHGDLIEIDTGDDVVDLKIDSIERWSWASRSKPTCACPDCKGTGKVACDECGGEGTVECNMGHEHDCEECDADGKWECESCDDGLVGDEEAPYEIVIRFDGLWQCDVTTFEGRTGCACGRDLPQDAYDAAIRDSERPRKKHRFSKEAA